MGINNPIPSSLKSESKKAAKILASFIKPNQVLGADEIIPHDVLLNAKGLAVLTVLKAGFLFSGRAGSGVVVARLPDGTWSPPSAIFTTGAGVGGQVGAELTDFVFILNTQAAVESFAQFGSVTLGGNISIAAGPLGRNAEVAANGSLKNIAAIFSYAKTKGIFAGVSIEGSAIVERREANRKFYGDNCKARFILSGRVAPPPACEPLMRILDSRAFTRASDNDLDDESYFDDIPSRFDDDNSSYNDNYSRRASTRPGSASRKYGSSSGYGYDDDDFSDDSARAYYSRDRQSHQQSSSKSATWKDDIYDRQPSQSNASLPQKQRSTPSNSGKAVALYSFAGQQDGDLPFRKGDLITIIQKSDSVDDWWTGRVGNNEGIFPANYVELV
ncbi:Lsb3 protein [Martiniozyma asiatica (nom. inval.)]|nr:Lsb3 protein [Martiniozyma asiatica]